MTPTDIKALRVALFATQEQFGKLIHAHFVTVSKWERGIGRPDAWQASIIRTCREHCSLRPKRLERARDLIKDGQPLDALGVMLVPVKTKETK